MPRTDCIKVFHECGRVKGWEDDFYQVTVVNNNVYFSPFVSDLYCGENKEVSFNGIQSSRLPRSIFFREPPLRPQNKIVTKFNELTSRQITEDTLEQIDNFFDAVEMDDLIMAIGEFSNLMQQARFLIAFGSYVSEGYEDFDWEEVAVKNGASAAFDIIKSIDILINGVYDETAMERPIKWEVEWACMNALSDAKDYFWLKKDGMVYFKWSPFNKYGAIFKHYYHYYYITDGEPGKEAYLDHVAGPPFNYIAIQIIAPDEEETKTGEDSHEISDKERELARLIDSMDDGEEMDNVEDILKEGSDVDVIKLCEDYLIDLPDVLPDFSIDDCKKYPSKFRETMIEALNIYYYNE